MACSGCSSGKDGKPAGCKSNGYCSSSGCNKLGVFDWLAGVPLATGAQPFDGVEVRFKNTRKAFYRNTQGLSLMPGDLVSVDAAPGFDVGMVSLTGELVRIQLKKKGVDEFSPEIKKILRKSTDRDIESFKISKGREKEILAAFHEKNPPTSERK